MSWDICTIYSYVFKEVKRHSFVYDSHFSTKEKSECCGAIIDNISFVPIYVLEEKDRKTKGALNNMLRKLFDVNCIVDFAFKVTANVFLDI